MTGMEIIAAERQRQIEEKGHTLERDKAHGNGLLAQLAVYYAMPSTLTVLGLDITPEVIINASRKINGYAECEFEFMLGKNRLTGDEEHDRNLSIGDRVKDLAKAGALIAAEIDRLRALEEW